MGKYYGGGGGGIIVNGVGRGVRLNKAVSGEGFGGGGIDDNGNPGVILIEIVELKIQ